MNVIRRFFIPIVILGFIAVVILTKIFGSSDVAVKTKAVVEVSTTKKVPSALADRDLTRLFDTLDWSNTAPGKYLGTVIPTDLVNWVLWPLALYLIYLIGRGLYLAVKGGSGGGSGWVPLAVLMATIFTFVTWNQGDKESSTKLDGEKLHAPSSDRLGFNGRKTFGLGDTIVHMTAQYPESDGQTIYLGCARIIRPDDPRIPVPHIVAVPQPDSYKNELRFNPKTVAFLLGQGITNVETEWHTVKSTNTNPVCPDGFTVWK